MRRPAYIRHNKVCNTQPYKYIRYIWLNIVSVSCCCCSVFTWLFLLFFLFFFTVGIEWIVTCEPKVDFAGTGVIWPHMHAAPCMIHTQQLHTKTHIYIQNTYHTHSHVQSWYIVHLHTSTSYIHWHYTHTHTNTSQIHHTSSHTYTQCSTSTSARNVVNIY